MNKKQCGPHCGVKDGYEGHCKRCHEIKESAERALENHAQWNSDLKRYL